VELVELQREMAQMVVIHPLVQQWLLKVDLAELVGQPQEVQLWTQISLEALVEPHGEAQVK
jgi:hypothetical protein